MPVRIGEPHKLFLNAAHGVNITQSEMVGGLVAAGASAASWRRLELVEEPPDSSFLSM
jgi:hypothetical protein